MDKRPVPWFTSAQLVVLQTILSAAYGAGIVWWYWQGGFDGRLVNIDQHPGIPYLLQIDLNDCDWPHLMVLPGIGEVLAKRIIQQREVQGHFHRMGDLAAVRGIGPRVLSRIRPYLKCVPHPDSLESHILQQASARPPIPHGPLRPPDDESDKKP